MLLAVEYHERIVDSLRLRKTAPSFDPAAALWHHLLSSITLFTGVHGW